MMTMNRITSSMMTATAQRNLATSQAALARLQDQGSVSYTHLTLPTILRV